VKAWTVVGWSYDADFHCPDCARARFGDATDDEDDPPEDSEGNEIHPLFAGDEGAAGEHCGDCFHPLI